MRFFLSIFLVLCTLQGCVTKNYGNYANLSEADSKYIANDTANKLASIRPPAATQLEVRQQINDDFGKSLIDNLREKGFAVSEITQVNIFDFSSAPVSYIVEDKGKQAAYSRNNLAKQPIKEAKAAVSKESTASKEPASIAIGYSITELGDGIHSVIIDIGDQTLSRAYLRSGKKISTAGAWAVRE